MSDHSIQELKNSLLEIFPDHPETLTFKRARGWLCRYRGDNISAEEFNVVCNELIAEGWLIRSGGAGSTLKLAESPPVSEPVIGAEVQLYPIVRKFIATQLVKDIQLDDCENVVEETANRGRTKGRFLHPDLMLVSRAHHRYLGKHTVNVYTFEVKTETGGNATAVLEALSQRQRSHFGYVIWNLPYESPCSQHLRQVEDYAKRFGIGLVLMRQLQQQGHEIADVTDYDVLVYATKTEPDPLQIESLIGTHVSEAGRNTVLGWHTTK